MILKISTLLLLFQLFVVLVFAQNRDVTIRLKNALNKPVPYATCIFNLVGDSLSAVTTITDSTGKIVIPLMISKAYTLNITAVGYKSSSQRIIPTATQGTFTFALRESSTTLKDVVVIARKPLLRQEDDKTIVDPEPLAETSTNAYEILEKTPGIFVDQDGNVYLNSTTPAQVYINGRETKMSAADMASLLKSLPPSSIARMEILRTPSAKYDASGGGGIVNLVLKKGVKLGMTGSVNAGIQQGFYGNQFLGFNLNNSNNDGRSSYLNVQASNRNSYEVTESDRQFAPDSLLRQDARTIYPSKNVYAGYGFGWSGTRWDLQYDGKLSFNRSNNHSDNTNQLVQLSTGLKSFEYLNTVDNKASSFYINQGGSAKLKIDTIGSEWSSDISYNYSTNPLTQDYSTIIQNGNAGSLLGNGDINNNRHFLTAQTDLRLKLKHMLTVETGLKTAITSFNSEADYYFQKNGTNVKDENRSNRYTYREGIHAVYLQASKTFGDFILKAGSRLENTNMAGHQRVPSDTSFAIHRTDLFPYIFLSKEIMKVAGYPIRSYLVYRRTISRPAYEQLNPFPRYVDQFLYETGNPSLRPQFTKNYEANVSVQDWPIIAVGYNDTKDIFNQVVYQSDTAQQLAYRTYDNLGTNKELYFRATAVIPPGKRYFFLLGTQYNRNFYEGLYEKQPLSFKRGSWSFFTYQTLKLDKRSTFTVNGFLRLKGQQQFYELGNFGSLNLSINRLFINRKLTVTASVNDLLKTNKYPFVLNQGNVHATGLRYSDTRRFGLNLRYNFGAKKKEDPVNSLNIESPEKSN